MTSRWVSKPAAAEALRPPGHRWACQANHRENVDSALTSLSTRTASPPGRSTRVHLGEPSPRTPARRSRPTAHGRCPSTHPPVAGASADPAITPTRCPAGGLAPPPREREVGSSTPREPRHTRRIAGGGNRSRTRHRGTRAPAHGCRAPMAASMTPARSEARSLQLIDPGERHRLGTRDRPGDPTAQGRLPPMDFRRHRRRVWTSSGSSLRASTDRKVRIDVRWA